MINISELKDEFDKIAASADPERSLVLFYNVMEAIESGALRVANKSDGEWIINSWVKSVILWGFQIRVMKEYGGNPLSFHDKNTYPVRSFRPDDGIRIVPEAPR